jgi:hypothetical protein
MSELQTMNATIRWRDTQEEEGVTLARMPYEWRDKLDQHPQDEAIFYWLTEQEWHLIGHEAFTNEEWEIVEINGSKLDPDTGTYEREASK